MNGLECCVGNGLTSSTVNPRRIKKEASACQNVHEDSMANSVFFVLMSSPNSFTFVNKVMLKPSLECLKEKDLPD